MDFPKLANITISPSRIKIAVVHVNKRSASIGRSCQVLVMSCSMKNIFLPQETEILYILCVLASIALLFTVVMLTGQQSICGILQQL